MTPSIVAYIGVGSNLHDPCTQVKQARIALKSAEKIIETRFSSLYSSPPMGPKNQPDYINAVMAIVTSLSPMELLRCLQVIENNQGRVREQHWGSRTLDLDLLLYDQRQINLPDLIVPHKGIKDRAFVLYPLQEIAPELMIPSLGSIDDLITSCPLSGLKKHP
ncbi:MAG: 2-amino-4-hydroxy-6-hydroxymethyldihydropteridine diphosphokinase [Methylococcales bacterium]|nr:2-amino-4-hydroxy-6-hydroxymethyldihydropteridine diphosphokinase [Methylococcales bacterium]MCK5924865.1 2-amino-4-hydroxy-6-hydroxymethyldihydropteridine diphosphokinase [Methylococcales bacterium]